MCFVLHTVHRLIPNSSLTGYECLYCDMVVSIKNREQWVYG